MKTERTVSQYRSVYFPEQETLERRKRGRKRRRNGGKERKEKEEVEKEEKTWRENRKTDCS